MCFYTLGFTAAIVLGVALPWRWSLGITAVILVLDLLALCTIHDSPQWLHKAGQYEAAEKSAAFYGLQAELKELISDEKVEKQGPLKPSSMQDKWEMAMNKLKQPTFYKPLGFLVVCMSSIELSCFPVISLYMVMIFQETGSPLDPYTTSVIVALARIISAFTASGLMQKYPRRPLYLASAATIALCHFTMSTYTYAVSKKWLTPEMLNTSGLAWLPLILVVIVFFAFTIGYGNVIIVMMGELLPSESKSLGNGVAFLAANTFSFLMVKMAPAIIAAIGIHGLFAMFGIVVTSMIVFCAMFMPETKGKTLAEIQLAYSGKCTDLGEKSKPIKALAIDSDMEEIKIDEKHESGTTSADEKPADNNCLRPEDWTGGRRRTLSTAA